VRVVALLSFRDEESFLPYLLASLEPLVDHIVALDDRSTDRGPNLVRATGATVEVPPAETTYGGRRQLLLELGRAAGGTHFVVVDADEAFTAGFSAGGRATIEALDPGGALAFPFRTLWKGPASYRTGKEYNMALACVFRDDGVSRYADTAIHESRLPGTLGLSARVVPAQPGAMVHLQFAAWERAQVKQAWYRCKEFLAGSPPIRVNARYLTTLDGPRVRTRPLDRSELSHLPSFEPLTTLPPGWHLDELLGWFATYGPSHFEALQIWHVPALAGVFQSAEGRPPRVQSLSPRVARVVGDLYGSARAAGRKVSRRLVPH
jgi:hypothetical protein